MAVESGNLFADIPASVSAELFTTLLARPGLRVERIVSRGQTTQPGQWYDQDWDEWVLLLSGGARLCIEGRPQAHILKPGDYVLLPAHCRHRVEWTDPQVETVWLALHIGDGLAE